MVARSPIQGQASSNFPYYRCELKSMAREPTTQNKVRMVRMLIDHEMLVGRERVHTWLRFAQGLGRAWHPLLQCPGDWFYVASLVYLTLDLFRVRQIPKAVKGCFDSIAEIWKAIERRGKSLPVQQKSREPQCIIGMGPRPEPGLDIALHANEKTERLERCLKPPSQRQDKLVRRNLRAVGKAQLEAFVSRMPA